MAKHRSVVGIILTIIGLIGIIVGAWSYLQPEDQQPFVGQGLLVAMIGIVILLIGGLLCSKATRTEAAAEEPVPSQPPPSPQPSQPPPSPQPEPAEEEDEPRAEGEEKRDE